MACCAFAAFIFGQLYLAWEATRDFVLRRKSAQRTLRTNTASSWRPGAEVSSASDAARKRLSTG
jgi:hypothetical protein